MLANQAVIDYLFFGKAFSVGSTCGLLVATIGMTLYAANDINFDFVGYLWLTANAAATVVNTFWNNVFIKQFKQRGAQVSSLFSVGCRHAHMCFARRPLMG